MKKTLYIPDNLWDQLQTYLKEHPQENISTVLQDALREKMRPRNGTKLLDLAGIVKNADPDASVKRNH